MFKDTKAFSSFSADDISKAKKFYGQTLGLEVSEKPEVERATAKSTLSRIFFRILSTDYADYTDQDFTV